MTTQPDLFTSAAEGERRRDAAIARAGANADPGFVGEARVAIKRAMMAGTFTTDDVWRELDVRHQTHERRALGAVMKQLQREGEIAPTQMFVPSNRPECHRRPIRVWQRR